MHHFYIPKIKLSDGIFKIEDVSQVRQIANVLRLRPGKEIVIFDGSGFEWQGQIKTITRNEVEIEKIVLHDNQAELPYALNLFQGVISKDRFELIVQKATELGVKKIMPVRCKFSQPYKINNERLRKIMIEAMEQCGRVNLVEIDEETDFDKAVESIDGGLVAWEGEEKKSLKAVLGNDIINNNNQEINIFIGPEGGFSDSEVDTLIGRGVKTFSLGKRILRAETAAIVSLGVIIELMSGAR